MRKPAANFMRINVGPSGPSSYHLVRYVKCTVKLKVHTCDTERGFNILNKRNIMYYSVHLFCTDPDKEPPFQYLKINRANRKHANEKQIAHRNVFVSVPFIKVCIVSIKQRFPKLCPDSAIYIGTVSDINLLKIMFFSFYIFIFIR